MARVQRSVVLIFLFVLAACARSISFSVEVNDAVPFPATATATATTIVTLPTPWVTDFAPTAPAPLPTFSFPTQERPVDFSPVLYGGNLYGKSFFLLLGGVSRNGWITPVESFARFSGEVTYSLNTLTIASKYFVWGQAPQFTPTCQNYFVDTDTGLDEADFTAVVDGWNVTKREVTELADDGLIYQQAVLDWLMAQGVDSPQPGTLQVFRVDLEGDGVNEIFISATHLDGSQHITNPGDYSIVLMRKVNSNDAVTIPVVADVYSSKNAGLTLPRTYTLANFIDLNQDGIMEVVVDVRKWEGFGAIVYQVQGQDVTQTLRTEC